MANTVTVRIPDRLVLEWSVFGQKLCPVFEWLGSHFVFKAFKNRIGHFITSLERFIQIKMMAHFIYKMVYASEPFKYRTKNKMVTELDHFI